MNKKQTNKGISLVILVITILVLIVIASAIILTVIKNNPFEQANQAVFKADLKQFSDDLDLIVSSMMIKNPNFDIDTLNADFESPNNLLETYIPSIKGKDKYAKMVIIEKGKLVLKKSELSPDKDKWADDIGVPIIGKPIVSKIKDIVLEAGMDNIKVRVLVDESENTIESYKYEIGKDINTLEVKDTNALKEYTFNNLEVNTKYFVKVTIKDKNNTNAIEPVVKEITTGAAVVPPGSVKITKTPELGEGAYINQNVIATITFPAIAGLKCRYSYDSAIWKDYTVPLIVTKNKTIYAKMTYLNNDEIVENIGIEIATINTIDKLTPDIPTVDLDGYTENSWSKTNVTINLTATDKVATSDNAMSNILGYEYSIDAGANYIAVPNNPLIISNDTLGMNILFKSIDKATNKSDATTSYIIKKDSTLPTISSVTESNITKTSMSITVTANDETSGIKGYKLSKDNGTTWIAEQTSNVFNLTGLTAGTEYNIKAKVIDNAENEKISTKNTIKTKPDYKESNETNDEGAASYSNPTIPKGFRPINDVTNWNNKETDYDNGLVIEDVSRNQFVWVPAGKYEYSAHYGATGTSDLSVDDMTQINKYGGFWIARYEASNNKNKVASKKNAASWTNINYNDSKARAESYGVDYGMNYQESWTSSLITGKMWDTTCKWIAADRTNVDSDSKAWGNYTNDPYTANNGKMNTGSREEFKKRNVYDIAR